MQGAVAPVTSMSMGALVLLAPANITNYIRMQSNSESRVYMLRRREGHETVSIALNILLLCARWQAARGSVTVVKMGPTYRHARVRTCIWHNEHENRNYMMENPGLAHQQNERGVHM